MLFDCFWREQGYERMPMETMEIQGTPTDSHAQEGGDEEGGLEEAATESLPKENVPAGKFGRIFRTTYSPQLMNRKDFSEMSVEESRRDCAGDSIDGHEDRHPDQPGGKKSRVRGNVIDPRWTMRRSMKYGGEVIDLVRRKKRIKKTRVVLLCDVSGSMDRYSRFLNPVHVRLAKRIVGS